MIPMKKGHLTTETQRTRRKFDVGFKIKFKISASVVKFLVFSVVSSNSSE